MERTLYLSDVRDNDWALVAPYLLSSLQTLPSVRGGVAEDVA
jgi:hypothetical protein